MDYPTLLASSESYRIYSRLATQVASGSGNIDYESELRNAETWVMDTLKKAFQIGDDEAKKILSSLSRMYVRVFEEASPFELEYSATGIPALGIKMSARLERN